jgi:hypothetical protein
VCLVCTSLLLCKQGKFLAFGSKAREDYYEHDESGMLFEKFKMRLHDDHRGSEPMAFALNGKTVPLLKVITHSLKSVKEDAMAEINRSQVVGGAGEKERESERRAHLFTYRDIRTSTHIPTKISFFLRGLLRSKS